MRKFRNLVTNADLSASELLDIVKLGEAIAKQPEQYLDLCHGKVLGSLFFEPSTRTRLSFEAAMLRLGGSVVTIPEPNVSSTTKGESLKDTIRTVSSYTDIIAMRHPHEGAGTLAAEVSPVPFINAGDGGHQHPTQTLTDLLTIYEHKHSLENNVIGLCGDLKFGRTVHSLVQTLSKFKGNKFIFISPKELQIPDYLRIFLNENNLEYKEVSSLDEVIDELDILYMTRVQKERFFNEADYIRLKDSYILNLAKLAKAKSDMIILHPLPRVNEIAEEVDQDPRAKYFNQVKNGMYVRMALILRLLEVK
ncbi:aspartate carbamoyltransferase [Amygdalobacter nucleatus]|uniref:Aspartate carbamoyltransferase n=1 Tax=Amygdalobacter nucleatus TaxID=3029274 RepID=A0A133YGB2_9FIRM|nr:aspartate carbamoyltransferase [Amygdalobacter nucleatus]KXB42226.1 aspartate carbamoyltransferase [Amygdalobacter nucleatus]MDF0486394.1 aspartate carbamoyltransferase [Amygdalobacter nucleatus]WEG37051.1 aspartate carbamoyltransferase [Amygdalobacter nucleatus]